LPTLEQLGDDYLTTMKKSKHEMLKAKWQDIIKDQSLSGQSITKWCELNGISRSKFYYWQRIVREETLIKAGTLAITNQTHFVEVKTSRDQLSEKISDTCAIIRSGGHEIEILNGSDPATLSILLNLLVNKYES